MLITWLFQPDLLTVLLLLLLGHLKRFDIFMCCVLCFSTLLLLICIKFDSAHCSLRNEMERNEMERNEMKICSLRNENLQILKK